MSTNKALIAEFKNEAANTRKMLERIPGEKLNWQPHDKSMRLGKLAVHIAEIPVWFSRIINNEFFDFATTNFNREEPENTESILKLFDERVAEAVQNLESATDENLNELWILKRGDHVFFQLPRKVVVRNFAMNHLYHHRGQLSVYLRLLDIPVPGMYGPTADELM